MDFISVLVAEADATGAVKANLFQYGVVVDLCVFVDFLPLLENIALNNFLHELGLIPFIQRSDFVGETECLWILADAVQRKGVDSRNTRLFVRWDIPHAKTFFQLSGCFVGECDRADAARLDALIHEPADALGEHAGLTRTSASNQTSGGTGWMFDRECLFFIQFHLSLVSRRQDIHHCAFGCDSECRSGRRKANRFFPRPTALPERKR